MTKNEEDRIRRAEEIQRYTENRCASLEKENEQLKCDLYNTSANLERITVECENLQQENAELKKDKEWLANTNNEQTEVILQLQAQIEKMKNCQNCKHSFSDGIGCIQRVRQNWCHNYALWELAD